MFAIWMVPYRRLNWPKVLLMAFIAYVLAFLLRAHEIPSWDNPAYQLNGDYLLATHDAYHWVAGAEGFGHGADKPMSDLLKLLSLLSGVSADNIAFWLPLFLAPLVAFITTIWAAVFGARNFGIVAGVLACLAPGFLGRTLLGYCDTDLVTLFFALLMGLVPAMWMAPGMRSPAAVVGSFLGVDVRRLTTVSPRYVRGDPLSRNWLIILFLAGVFGNWTKEWHSLFNYLVMLYALLIPLVIFFCSIRSERADLLRGAPVYVLPLIGGLPGAIIAIVLLLGLLNIIPALNRWLWHKRAPFVLWGIVALGALEPQLMASFMRFVGIYLKNSTDVAVSSNATALAYPGVAQSIIEVQDLSLADLLFYFHPWAPVVMAGILGFVILLCVSPAAAFHLPLVILAFLSLKLGGRLVMFGGASIALGLTVPLCLWLEKVLEKADIRQWIKKIPLPDLAVAFLLLPYVALVPKLSQGPILYVQHAEALKSLRTSTPAQAEVWTWWDWGYATQYFAMRETLADGALHGGPYLYLPAAVYTTDNPLLASQLIKYTAVNGGPEKVFYNKNAAEITALLKRLGTEKINLKPEHKQYLVVSFDMLRLGFWISSYGNWNFLEKKGKAYSISRIRQALKYNLNSGLVEISGRDSLQAESLDILTSSGLERQSYFRFNQRHFVLNFLTGDKLILDDGLYNSMMVQLLLAPAGDARFGDYFKLVYNNTYCRVYEVL